MRKAACVPIMRDQIQASIGRQSPKKACNSRSRHWRDGPLNERSSRLVKYTGLLGSYLLGQLNRKSHRDDQFCI
jgi:hypothetical protein